MPSRDTTALGEPCWVDLMTSDPATTRKFYTSVFGWEDGEAAEEFGGYFQFFKDGVPVCGVTPSARDYVGPDAWSVYLAVDDVAEALARSEKLGAQVVFPAMTVGDLGTMGVMIDPSGAAVGVWSALSFPGFGVTGEPGAPEWFEQHSRDYSRALAFYRDAFDWEIHAMSDTGEFRYSTSERDGRPFAGIMDSSGHLPEGVPSYWTVHFGSDNTDLAVERTLELGGSVVTPAADSPYGRVAALCDATGATFRVMQR